MAKSSKKKPGKETKSEKVSKEVKEAIERWRQYFKENIFKYHFMHSFVLGKQWDDEESDTLLTFGKRPMQMNKLSTMINTLLGEQQQNTPQIEIVPLSNCDEETAQIRQVLTKDIMFSSDSKTVYQSAASQAFIGGYGAYLLDHDYVNPTSFDQQPIYREIKDPTHCYWDVSAKKVSKIDGMRCGYWERISKRAFKKIYGSEIADDIEENSSIAATKEEVGLQGEPGIQNSSFEFVWQQEDYVTIVYDYERVYENDTLYLLSNNETMFSEELEEHRAKSDERIAKEEAQMIQEMLMMQQEQVNPYMVQGEMAPPDMQLMPDMQPQGMQPEFNPEGVEPQMDSQVQPQMPSREEQHGEYADLNQIPEGAFYLGNGVVTIDNERKVKRPKIIHRVITGNHILDETVFPADDLPLIFVDQNSYIDEHGLQVCRSFVEDAIDPQRYINYLATQSSYLLKTYRYDQFMGSKENVRSLDTQNIWRDPGAHQGMLVYDESESGAKPEQLVPPELPMSLISQYERATEDLHTCTGLYPTRMGNQGNEISGKAIDARARQGSYPTFVAFNSINRAITAGAKVLNQMIPRVYDTERVVSLLTPDKGRQSITLNESGEYEGIIKNNIRRGTYDVVLQAGPSYEGQKMEALDSLNQVLATNPTMFNLVADLYAENLPLSNTLEIKNRFKTIVPPEITQAGKTGEMPDQAQTPSPQDQAAMADIQFKQEQIEIKKAELQLKIEEAQASTRLKEMEMEIRRLEAAAQLEEQKLRYLAETDRTRSDNQISHADNLVKILIAKQDNDTTNRG